LKTTRSAGIVNSQRTVTFPFNGLGSTVKDATPGVEVGVTVDVVVAVDVGVTVEVTVSVGVAVAVPVAVAVSRDFPFLGTLPVTAGVAVDVKVAVGGSAVGVPVNASAGTGVAEETSGSITIGVGVASWAKAGVANSHNHAIGPESLMGRMVL
jgi:hypothetical protein